MNTTHVCIKDWERTHNYAIPILSIKKGEQVMIQKNNLYNRYISILLEDKECKEHFVILSEYRDKKIDIILNIRKIDILG